MGTGEDDEARHMELERWIPSLTRAEYELTSPPAAEYNCVAWAADDTTNRWEDLNDDWYWPIGASLRDGTMASLVEAFAALGYEQCDDAKLDDGYEKVALYGSPQKWRHAAKQLPDGRWSSKCGFLDDIAHNDLSDIYCDAYGVLQCIMRRRRAADEH